MKTFRGGIHPCDHKKQTYALALQDAQTPEEVVIPLVQHVGKPAKPVVEAGERVAGGQRIGEASGSFSAHVHASISGEITAVKQYPSPLGITALSIIIKSDGKNTLKRLHKLDKPKPKEIIERVLDAGIVGMGGAMFPSHIKLTPPPNTTLDTVIINGSECDLYLSSDHRIMIEKTEQIVRGAQHIKKAVNAKRCIIGIEENKQDAIERFQEHSSEIDTAVLETKYPQGAEKMLIKSVTGREIAPGKLPAHVGAVVFNVSTACAISEAIDEGMPLISRAVTVAGAVKKPANIIVPIGTRVQDLLQYCGKEKCDKVVMGGAMMGIAQSNLTVPVIKGTTGIVAIPHNVTGSEMSCIRCGRCVSACPMHLMPQELAKHVIHERFYEAKAIGLYNCFECGCCTYSCPSKIPLGHIFKYGKVMLSRYETAKQKNE